MEYAVKNDPTGHQESESDKKIRIRLSVLLGIRGERILIFQLLIHIRKNFCMSISNPYPKISEI